MNKAAGIAIALALITTAAVADSPTTPPPGAMQFCIKNESFCTAHAPASAPGTAMDLIKHVNTLVNDRIKPDPLSSDASMRAENGNWRVVAPNGIGGCVEYTWTKYMLLAWQGVPVGAMRFAQVNSSGDPENHAVLLVRVDGDEVVLDNLTPVIWHASSTRYDWISIQDEANGWNWVKPVGAPR